MPEPNLMHDLPHQTGVLLLFALLVESPVIIPVTQVRNWGVILDTLMFPVLHLIFQPVLLISLSSIFKSCPSTLLTDLPHPPLYHYPNLVSSSIADISSYRPAEKPLQWLPITFRMPTEISNKTWVSSLILPHSSLVLGPSAALTFFPFLNCSLLSSGLCKYWSLCLEYCLYPVNSSRSSNMCITGNSSQCPN